MQPSTKSVKSELQLTVGSTPPYDRGSRHSGAAVPRARARALGVSRYIGISGSRPPPSRPLSAPSISGPRAFALAFPLAHSQTSTTTPATCQTARPLAHTMQPIPRPVTSCRHLNLSSDAPQNNANPKQRTLHTINPLMAPPVEVREPPRRCRACSFQRA